MNNLYAIIVAGGSGTRFGSQVPKQFLPLNGLPILMHTINAFHSFNSSIQFIITLPPDYFEFWKSLCVQHNFNIQHKIVTGGATRFHSVKNGLDEVSGGGIVAIHDAVRPLVSQDTMKRCFENATKLGNAIPVISLVDSIREKKEKDSFQVDRENFVLVQTPQVFDIKIIKKAYNQPFHSEFTDDASVLEQMGEKINLVEGNRENIKITNQMDMVIAEVLLSLMHSDN